MRTFRRTVPRRWWSRAPFVPVPSAAYLRFRMQTQYGDDRAPEPGDVVRYLQWCRDWRRATRPVELG